ncbi:MAG: DUF4185 domain-containing protein [Verrucomicrobiae bacterium]|nr:DUF4185 domain-containing protein [Verrucomicrobiae bacterium]
MKPFSPLLFIVLCFTQLAYADPENEFGDGVPDTEWDALFSRTEGWSGGDVAGTIPLADGRTVWVFGDSWIGNVAEGKHVGGSHLVNNAIGVHSPSTLGNERAPRYSDLTFYWGNATVDEKPTAWVRPLEHADTQWFWASGGGAVVPSADGMSDRLVVFLFHITKTSETDDSVWNFQGIGEAMAIVDNPNKPAGDWSPRTVLIPRKQGQKPISWGVSAHVREIEKKSFLYVYGVLKVDDWNKQLFVARVPATNFEKIEHWTYFADNDGWSESSTEAAPIANGVTSELSVHPRNGKYYLIQSEPLFGHHIMLRTATSPEGKWSEPKAVYKVPGLDRGDYFTYAAKGHPHLSGANDLLVTYIVNAHDFWSMAADASIYRPRFIRVPLK